jgi:hypothetical protein
VEAYILDSLRRRVAVVDVYESFIWTDRYRAFGDFELLVQSTPENRKRLMTGTTLASNVSYSMMILETVEDKTDAEGRQMLRLTGRSLEQILDRRVAKDTLGDTTLDPKWVLEGLPAAIARQLFHDICVTGNLSVRDIIPSVIEGSIFPPGTIAEPSEEIIIEIEPMTLYTALVRLCDMYGMGFRFIRNFDTSELYFEVYMGSDRTSSQTTFPAVVFSPTLDNLQNTNELTTMALYGNVAYVFSPAGSTVVYADGLDPDLVEGWERRVVMVNATDITVVDPPESPEVILARLVQKGKEALSGSKVFSAFDGEISQTSIYKPGRDYFLGDMIEVRSKTGATNKMQITEQIFVSDRNGERSYPSLEINQFITPGSWAAWDYNKVWEDYGLTEYWEDQP